jgi:hypothetical protein
VAALSLKPGADIKTMTPALAHLVGCLFWVVAEDTDPDWPANVVVTSVHDGTHTLGGAHYRDEALDIRTHNFRSAAGIERFRARLESRLGASFVVLHEGTGSASEHLHAQLRKRWQWRLLQALRAG